MQSVRYGRMEYGKCLPAEQKGPIGCFEDVTGYMDSLCSGKQECSFLPVVDDYVKASNPCPSTYIAYMDASYVCAEGRYQMRFQTYNPQNKGTSIVYGPKVASTV